MSEDKRIFPERGKELQEGSIPNQHEELCKITRELMPVVKEFDGKLELKIWAEPVGIESMKKTVVTIKWI